MSSASTKNHSPLWRKILNSMNRIMKSHSPHFHVLSVLFLFPSFFTLVVYPSFHLAFFHPQYHLNSFKIIVPLVYTLLLAFFFLCAVATITYSAVQASYDKPVNLVSSVKSIRNSFFPLLSTFIVSLTIFISIALLFTNLLDFSVQTFKLKYDSNNLWFLFILVIVPILLWLQVNWSLAYVIAVVESKCGFETLRRSAYLVKGKRWVALSMMMFYGLVMGMLVIPGSMYLVLVDAAKGNKWRSLGVILQTAECSVGGFLMMNQYLVGNVALYMYCKDFNGEKLPFEIGDKFTGAGEYVSMPLDDEKKNKNHGIV